MNTVLLSADKTQKAEQIRLFNSWLKRNLNIVEMAFNIVALNLTKTLPQEYRIKRVQLNANITYLVF